MPDQFSLEQFEAAINNAFQGNPRTTSTDFAQGAITPQGQLFSSIDPSFASGESDLNSPVFKQGAGFDINSVFGDLSLLGPDGKVTPEVPSLPEQQGLERWANSWASQGDPNPIGLDTTLALISLASAAVGGATFGPAAGAEAGAAGGGLGASTGSALGAGAGAEAGGAAGGLGASTGAALGSAPAASSFASEFPAASVAGGTSQEVFTAGSQAASPFNPASSAAGGITGATGGGGSAPGASIGTDPSTTQSIGGGATGGASTPGSPAIGTGATPTPSAAPSAPSGSQFLNPIKDLNTVQSLVGLANTINPTNQPNQTGTSVPQGPPDQTQPPIDQSPIGGASPVSQIAAQPTPAPAPLPSGQFDQVTQNFVKQKENEIRAQFGSQGITGSPMEQVAIQRADQAAQARASEIEQAMSSTGVSDPSIFSALMGSGLQANQFAQALQQLRARNAV